MNSKQDKMCKILDDQKNITDIAISYFNIKIIEEFYDPTLIDNIHQTFMYTARKSYDSLHFEANKKDIQEKMPEVTTYSLENNIKLGSIETATKMSNILKMSKMTLDIVLIGIKTGRIFTDKGVEDIDDINNNIKICGYYMSAYFAKDFCKNKKIYNYMKRNSIAAYKELKDENSKKVLLQYVDREFLNVK